MIRIFAAIGILVTLFALCGAIGIGHFRLYYGPNLPACEAKS